MTKARQGILDADLLVLTTHQIRSLRHNRSSKRWWLARSSTPHTPMRSFSTHQLRPSTAIPSLSPLAYTNTILAHLKRHSSSNPLTKPALAHFPFRADQVDVEVSARGSDSAAWCRH